MTIKEIYGELNTIFPKDNSCSWDNDGLMVCSDSNKEVKKVLLALDATKTVIDSSKGYDLILTHHPLIFRKIGDVTDSKVSTSKLITLIKNDTAVMSFHTRFDGGDGGMNDILAKKFALKNIEKFGDFGEPALCRMGDIEPTTAKELAIKAKTILNSPYVLYTDAQKPIKKVAICSGDGGSVINNALSKGADALITGR
ncbi:MAG: Nif3-like dinuclear metal center hexameric protein, partial [Clostridia bacterium]|nr:Nif3-like dinuclear metal center hexameric protein [Clostridia bacterium]